MVTRFLLHSCGEHPDCTLKMGFVAEDDSAFDPVSDRKPVSARMQLHAEENFGPVYCVSLDHLEGRLTVQVPG